MYSATQFDLFRQSQLTLPNQSFEKRNDVVKSVQVERTLTLIPSLSMHPGQINLFKEVCWHPSKPPVKTNESGEIIQKIKYEHLLEYGRTANGKVSAIAKRKILKAIKYMLFMASEKTIHNNYSGRHFNFKLAFVTLTLPSKQIHSDNEIKSKILNQFLIEIKKSYNVKNYIWRAEKQKNGNLHFHLLVDRFIPYQELRDRWNRVVEKLGYVSRYRQEQINWHSNGFRLRSSLIKTWSAKKQFDAYTRNSKIHWNSPNSTDIHSIRKINNVKEYFAKYLTKNEVLELTKLNENIDLMVQKGRIWGCNQELSKIKGAQAVVDSKIESEIEDLLKSNDVKIISDTYFQVIFFDMEYLVKRPDLKLFKIFSKYIFETFNISLQTEIAA